MKKPAEKKPKILQINYQGLTVLGIPALRAWKSLFLPRFIRRVQRDGFREVKIKKVAWAKVAIGDQDYWQVLIIGPKVIPREVGKIKEKYGTDHVIPPEEQKLLLSEKPEIILIANGWSGVLKVDSKFKKKAANLGIELQVALTPKAVRRYNRLTGEGKKVNALIHTTC